MAATAPRSPAPRKNTAKRHAVSTLRRWIEQQQWKPGTPVPSVRDLAKQLNVSRTTAHQAMRSLQDAGLVRQDPMAGGYTVGPAGGGAASVMTRTICILTELDGARALSGQPGSSGWEVAVQFAILDRARQASLHPMLLHLDALRDGDVAALAVDRPRGLIIMDSAGQSPRGQRVVEQLHQAGVPAVSYGTHDSLAGVDHVASDHQAGCYDLTRHLIEQGRRRILRLWLLSDPRQTQAPWLAQRNIGYERACHDAGLTPLPALIPPTPPSGAWPHQRLELFEATSRFVVGYLLEHLQGPGAVDAIMLSSDGYVPAVIAACRRLNRVPHRDVAVVGYDNYWHDLPAPRGDDTPPLASVDKLHPRLGGELLDLLEDRIAGRLPASPQLRLVPPRLVIHSPEQAR
jgi:DNA-binding LacI/PurR family transcriptional regulator